MLAWRRSRAWRIVRGIWVAAGLSVLVWMVLSFNDWNVGEGVLRSDDRVEVVETEDRIAFAPRGGASDAALLFLPGGMVDPHAYAPLLRRIAEAGHPAVLVKLPSLGGRFAAGMDGRREAVRRSVAVLAAAPEGSRWVVAGHSLGGLLAAMVARESPPRLGGLVLLGTTHPRDFSLAEMTAPVVKVYGTRDGVAPYERMWQNAANLPAAARWVAIEGGNHSQFGYYGFQLGDRRARIPRAVQQAQVHAVLLEALEGATQANGRTR